MEWPANSLDLNPIETIWFKMKQRIKAYEKRHRDDALRLLAIRSLEITADQKIVTIEGLSPDTSHPLQKAWLDLDVPQCGYCQTGQIMAAAALLQANPNPSDEDIVAEMTNICRCGTYNRIKAAIKQAAAQSRG